MRILGIDYGDRNIGLAVSDKLLVTGHALSRYRVRSKEEDEKYFKKIVSTYGITQIVVGLPLRMDGSFGSQAQKTKEFGNWLESILNIPVIFWDERLSTKQSVKILSHQKKLKPRTKKNLKDQISACIILSSYLESKRVEFNDSKNH